MSELTDLAELTIERFGYLFWDDEDESEYQSILYSRKRAAEIAAGSPLTFVEQIYRDIMVRTIESALLTKSLNIGKDWSGAIGECNDTIHIPVLRNMEER